MTCRVVRSTFMIIWRRTGQSLLWLLSLLVMTMSVSIGLIRRFIGLILRVRFRVVIVTLRVSVVMSVARRVFGSRKLLPFSLV